MSGLHSYYIEHTFVGIAKLHLVKISNYTGEYAISEAVIVFSITCRCD